MKKMVKQIGIFILLMMSITSCEKDTKSLLIGQWEIVESSALGNLSNLNISGYDEYFSDGTGITESDFLKESGLGAVNFTWKIDGEGRLIHMTQSQTKIYTIVEISKSTLVLEQDVPIFGKVREKYSKRKGSTNGGADNRNGETDKTTNMPDNNQKNVQKGTFTDSRDGKNYKTVKIGKQVWLAENLNYAANGSKCYDNKTENCDKYGRLYNWTVAMNACPKFWHLPSDAEWNDLMTAIGDYKTAGKFLKAMSGWNENGNGTDAYGFAALPSGISSIRSDREFGGIGSIAIWWNSSTNDSTNKAYIRFMEYDNDGVYLNFDDKSWLRSVRCVQDRSQYEEQISELEQEAEKWIKNKCRPHEYKQGEYFSFSCTARIGCTDCGGDFSSVWTATSKTIIGDCSKNSVWKMMYSFDDGYEGGNNEISHECKSITPKVIINYKFSSSPEGD